MPFLQIDGPCLYGFKSVTTSASELRVGGSALEERKLVSIMPTDGFIYFGFDSSVTTSTGTKVFKNQYIEFEASPLVTVYMISSSGTVNVRITERA